MLEKNRTARLGPGELFGEIAAIARTPRTATVIAEEPATLLELRWQGLREIRSMRRNGRDTSTSSIVSAAWACICGRRRS